MLHYLMQNIKIYIDSLLGFLATRIFYVTVEVENTSAYIVGVIRLFPWRSVLAVMILRYVVSINGSHGLTSEWIRLVPCPYALAVSAVLVARGTWFDSRVNGLASCGLIFKYFCHALIIPKYDIFSCSCKNIVGGKTYFVATNDKICIIDGMISNS